MTDMPNNTDTTTQTSGGSPNATQGTTGNAPSQNTTPSGDQTSTTAQTNQSKSEPHTKTQTGGQSDGQKTETQTTQQTDTQSQQSPEGSKDFKVPDAYKDKGWASKVKSMDDVYKQLDELDALKGKKTAAPDLSKATPEEREAYYATTRPKEAAEYQFTEGVAVDPAIEGGVREMLMKNGISATQGNEIIKAYQTIEQKLVEQQFDPEGYKQAMQTAFGDKWESITGATRNILKGIMSPEDNTALDHIPNVYLGVIYRTLGNVYKSFGINEQMTAHLQAGSGTVVADVATKRSNMRAEITKLGKQPFPPTAKIQELKNQLAESYKNDARRTDAKR